MLSLLLLAPALSAQPPRFAGPPPPYFIDESMLPFASLPGTSTETAWGVQKGAAFQIEVPDVWNGDLVLVAHGFRGSCVEPTDGGCEL